MDSPGDLQLEGSKIRSADLVTTLHKVMTSRPFPREPAHRVLIVFSPDDQVRKLHVHIKWRGTVWIGFRTKSATGEMSVVS